jgi:hypothetical protein
MPFMCGVSGGFVLGEKYDGECDERGGDVPKDVGGVDMPLTIDVALGEE